MMRDLIDIDIAICAWRDAPFTSGLLVGGFVFGFIWFWIGYFSGRVSLASELHRLQERVDEPWRMPMPSDGIDGDIPTLPRELREHLGVRS